MTDLVDFVRQSNMIEGEPTEPGHPLFDDYLVLAREVAAGDWTDLNQDYLLEMHERLLLSQPSKFPGEFRQCRVTVGGNEKMHPVLARPAMRELFNMIHAEPSGELETWCWEMHHRFEWIHPFIDGNGRTGRLLLNILRLKYGLPWLTVRYEDRFAYYRSIEEWEHTMADCGYVC